MNQLLHHINKYRKASGNCGLSLPFFGLLFWFSTTVTFAAEIQLSSPFVDHMVVQRGKPIQIWGSADPGSIVDIKLADRQAHATASADGSWHIKLDPLPAGGPYELTATSNGSTAVVHDVLIGDVWLCSGQSNMQFSLGECVDGPQVAAVAHPKLRIGQVGTAWTSTPQTTAKINWNSADKSSALKFSAVAYAFAHELENDPALQDVPIGILEDCLGGTVIESWLPQSALTGFDPKELQSSMFGIGPTLLYNGMIAPLGHSSFAGVIWYQGEGNAGAPARYAKLLPMLFKTWRDQFEDPNLPMLVVQLPDYATDWGGIYWQWIRESQATAVAQTPNTALAVTINTNDGWNLHPQGKHEIGRRLALLARQEVYKEKVVGRGPVFKSAQADGSKLIATFDPDGDHLTSGASPTDGFMVAGKDGVYHTAEAAINGDTVTVTCPDVPQPQTVRYAWMGVPHSTLTNSSGIPAAPFRTDRLPISIGHGEAQFSPTGYTFKGKDYQIAIASDGSITSLIVQNQQLLSNAPDSWGGARVKDRVLSNLKLINPQRLICSNNETSLQIDFEDNNMRLTLSNLDKKEPAVFHIALASSVSVSSKQKDTQTLKRKTAGLRVSGIDSVTAYQDIAAEDGKVLETTIAPGETKVIELNPTAR